MDYPIQIPAQLSSHIRGFRKSKKLSQAELGARMGLSQARIARIEGDPLSVSVEQLLRLLSVLDVRMTLELLPSIKGSVALSGLTARRADTSTRAPKGSKTAVEDEDW